MTDLIIRRDNKIDKLDLSKKLALRAFLGFCDWWDELLVVTGRVER